MYLEVEPADRQVLELWGCGRGHHWLTALDPLNQRTPAALEAWPYRLSDSCDGPTEEPPPELDRVVMRDGRAWRVYR